MLAAMIAVGRTGHGERDAAKSGSMAVSDALSCDLHDFLDVADHHVGRSTHQMRRAASFA
jgi:hypothetical protein